MTKGIFITGTDTDVGKTVITAGIMHLLRTQGCNATYFKAALSGAVLENGKTLPGDTRFVCEFSRLNEEYEKLTPYVYKTSVSPHLASKIENNPIDIDVVKEKFNQLKEKYEYIVAEGSGGVVCPLICDENNTYLLYELIKELGMSVIIVSRSALGTINHTVLTVEFLEKLGMDVKGIIINGFEENNICHKDNVDMIKRLTKVPIIAVIPVIENVNVENMEFGNLKQCIEDNISIEKLISCMGEI